MKNFVATLLASLFVMVFIAALWLMNLRALIAQPDILGQSLFTPTNLRHVLAAIEPELDALYDRDLEEQIPLLTSDQWQQVKRELLDAPWLSAQLISLHAQLSEWLIAGQGPPRLIVDAAEKREVLATTIDRAFRDSYYHLPSCGAVQDLGTSCRDDTVTYDAFLAAAAAKTQSDPAAFFLPSTLPSSFDLLALESPQSATATTAGAGVKVQQQLKNLQSLYRASSWWLFALLGVDALLLIVLVSLKHRRSRQLPLWLGSIFVTTATTAWLAIVALQRLVPQSFTANFTANEVLPEQVTAGFADVIAKTTAALVQPQRVPLLLLLGIGLLCFLVPVFFRPRPKQGPILIRH